LVVTQNQKVIPKFNCSNDKFIFDKDKKKIELIEEFDDQSLSSFDITGYFSQTSFKEDGSSDCPISSYKISKVYDSKNDVDVPLETYNNAFYMNP